MNSYRFDSHVHTSEVSPCGKVDAVTLVHLYKQAGYHGLVITDHYYRDYFEKLKPEAWEDKIDLFLSGYHHALEEGRKIGLKVLLGIEIRFDESNNDYLVYGLNEDFLYRNKCLYELSLKTFYNLIHNTPITIFQAHPFRVSMIPANPQHLHGIEVYNGNPRHHSNNSKASDYAQINSLKMISGSDFHQIQDLARGGIILPEAPSTSEEFARLLMEDKITCFIRTE